MAYQGRKQERPAGRCGIVRGAVTVLAAMAALSGLLLVLLAVILYRAEVGETFIRVGIVITYVLSGLLGGFLAGKLSGERRLFWGLAAGLLYFGVLLLVSVLLNGTAEVETSKAVATLGLCAASGMVGGTAS